MGFSLNGFTPSEGTGNYVSKVLLPGSYLCKVKDLRIDKAPYDAAQYNLQFVLEGPEVEDPEFVGLPVNRLDPSKGSYKGQIATVKSSQYAYKDWEYKGKTILRDDSIQNWLGNFLKGVNLLERFQALNVTAESIEDLVAEIRAFLLKEDTAFAFTIAGQKYYKEGSEYPSYSLYLPKKAEGKTPYAVELTSENFLQFNEALHITEKKVVEPASESTLEGFMSLPTDLKEQPVFTQNTTDLSL
jgi:hypothetical protein